jgi:hypothetical protein
MSKIVKHRTPWSLIAVGALMILGLPFVFMLGEPFGAQPSAMPAASIQQLRDANAEIVAGLVVELADPDLDAKTRRRKEAQLKAAKERLAWAEEYLRLGHDPETGRREALGR